MHRRCPANSPTSGAESFYGDMVASVARASSTVASTQRYTQQSVASPSGGYADRRNKTQMRLSPRLPAAFAGLVASLFLLASVANAAEPTPVHAQIDQLIAIGTPDYIPNAAPRSDDAEFVRRVTLDLTGSIPEAAATQTFLADATPDKRTKLIDTLLASPEYARHMQRCWDVVLMRRLPGKHVDAELWEKYLRESFASNRPWYETVQGMIKSDGSDPAQRGAARFLLDRDSDVTTITRDVSRLFLGANLECAQCHDHPQVDDYLQHHYYGVAAFFNRSYVFAAKDKPTVLAEKSDGEVSFESVFEIRDKVSKGPKTTGPKLFNSSVISDPSFAQPDQAYVVAPAENVQPIPRFSRRAKFAEIVITPDNRRFCRTTVNRIWAQFMGRGIVHPLDFDHSDNPPSHPALLAMLTEEFAARGTDIKWLIREIVLSETYQRSSQLTPEAKPLAENSFAQASLRPLTPEQFAAAILTATGETQLQRTALGANANEETLYKQLKGYEHRFAKLFGGLPGKPKESFDSSSDQVLFLMNDPMVLNLMAARGDNLADRMQKRASDQPQAIADELTFAVFSRPATADEVSDVTSSLAGLVDGPRQSEITNLIWSAVMSAEFRFNH